MPETLRQEARGGPTELGAGVRCSLGEEGRLPCRGSWPSQRDASVCHQEQMCLSVSADDEKKAVQSAWGLSGCEIPYL